MLERLKIKTLVVSLFSLICSIAFSQDTLTDFPWFTRPLLAPTPINMLPGHRSIEHLFNIYDICNVNGKEYEFCILFQEHLKNVNFQLIIIEKFFVNMYCLFANGIPLKENRWNIRHISKIDCALIGQVYSKTMGNHG